MKEIRFTMFFLASLFAVTTACGTTVASQQRQPLSPSPSAVASQPSAVASQQPTDFSGGSSLPPVPSGTAVRLLPAHGAVGVKDVADYLYYDSSAYVLQTQRGSTKLDPSIGSVRWTSDGQLVGISRIGASIDLVRIANDGGITRMLSGLKSTEFVVGGDVAVVLTDAGLAALDLRASPAAPDRLRLNAQPTAWSEDHARVSPTGRYLALADGGRLLLFDLSSGAQLTIAGDFDARTAPIGWTWAGDAVLFGRASTAAQQAATLWRYDIATGRSSDLWTGGVGAVALPAGTPRGVVFEFLPRGTQKEEQSEYWFVPGSSARPVIFQHGGVGLAVSADGAWFSFSRTIGPFAGSYVGGLP